MSATLLSLPSETSTSESVPWPLRTTVHAIATTGDSHLRDRWLAAFERDPQASSWQHPLSVLAECRALETSRCPPLLIECLSSAETVGAAILLPKSITTRQLGGIGPKWTLQGYRLVGGRMLNVDQDAAVDQQLLQAVYDAVTDSAADFLLIEDIDQPSPLWSSVTSSLPSNWKAFTPNGVQSRLRIRLPEQGDGYWQQFSSKTRGTFRRKLKKFGETKLERITRADEVPNFLAVAHQISLQTWQSRQLGLRVRNSAAEQASLSALADAGLLRCYLWSAQGEPAAFCIGNQAQGTFHYEEVGYATQFAKFSPGQMLVVQMIEDLLAYDRPHTFDFGGGDADYKRMFANDVSQSGTVWLTPPRWKSRGALHWGQFCRSLKTTARQTAQRLGLATRVRQWIRYGGATATPPTSTEAEETT